MRDGDNSILRASATLNMANTVNDEITSDIPLGLRQHIRTETGFTSSTDQRFAPLPASLFTGCFPSLGR